jgi:hypothetical protein
MSNPTQINQGGAANQERQPKEQTGQGIVGDDRGQEQPSDKGKAQQTSSRQQHGQSVPPLNDEPTAGDEAQKQRDKMQKQEKAEGDR